MSHFLSANQAGFSNGGDETNPGKNNNLFSGQPLALGQGITNLAQQGNLFQGKAEQARNLINKGTPPQVNPVNLFPMNKNDCVVSAQANPPMPNIVEGAHAAGAGSYDAGIVAQNPRNMLKNLAYHLRDQARLIQINLPESLEQYKSLAILFDLIDLCEAAIKIDGSKGKDPRAELQELFWRAVKLLKAVPHDGFSPFRSYGLRLEHTIQSMWAAYARRPSVQPMDSAYSVPEIKLLAIGSNVEYYSQTFKKWLEATVLGHLPNGDYQLDIQSVAKKDNVRPVIPKREADDILALAPGRPVAPENIHPNAEVVLVDDGFYAVGSIVEYWSASMSQWILAEVRAYNRVSKTYTLDCKNAAPRDRVRPHIPQERPNLLLDEKTRPVLQKFEGESQQEAPSGRKITKERRGSGGKENEQDVFVGAPVTSSYSVVLDNAPKTEDKETRENQKHVADEPYEEKMTIKTHHDMATGKIVQTQITEQGDHTKFIYDYGGEEDDHELLFVRQKAAKLHRSTSKIRSLSDRVGRISTLVDKCLTMKIPTSRSITPVERSKTPSESSKKPFGRSRSPIERPREVRSRRSSKRLKSSSPSDYKAGESGMRRSTVLRERTTDFIRGTGNPRGNSKLNVIVLTGDKKDVPKEQVSKIHNPYIEKIGKMKKAADHERRATQEKVDLLTLKAKALVERFEQDTADYDSSLAMDIDVPAIPTVKKYTSSFSKGSDVGSRNRQASPAKEDVQGFQGGAKMNPARNNYYSSSDVPSVKPPVSKAKAKQAKKNVWINSDSEDEKYMSRNPYMQKYYQEKSESSDEDATLVNQNTRCPQHSKVNATNKRGAGKAKPKKKITAVDSDESQNSSANETVRSNMLQKNIESRLSNRAVIREPTVERTSKAHIGRKPASDSEDSPFRRKPVRKLSSDTKSPANRIFGRRKMISSDESPIRARKPKPKPSPPNRRFSSPRSSPVRSNYRWGDDTSSHATEVAEMRAKILSKAKARASKPMTPSSTTKSESEEASDSDDGGGFACLGGRRNSPKKKTTPAKKTPVSCFGSRNLSDSEKSSSPSRSNSNSSCTKSSVAKVSSTKKSTSRGPDPWGVVATNMVSSDDYKQESESEKSESEKSESITVSEPRRTGCFGGFGKKKTAKPKKDDSTTKKKKKPLDSDSETPAFKQAKKPLKLVDSDSSGPPPARETHAFERPAKRPLNLGREESDSETPVAFSRGGKKPIEDSDTSEPIKIGNVKQKVSMFSNPRSSRRSSPQRSQLQSWKDSPSPLVSAQRRKSPSRKQSDSEAEESSVNDRKKDNSSDSSTIPARKNDPVTNYKNTYMPKKRPSPVRSSMESSPVKSSPAKSSPGKAPTVDDAESGMEQDQSESISVPQWTPWGGSLGFGRFEKIEDSPVRMGK